MSNKEIYFETDNKQMKIINNNNELQRCEGMNMKNPIRYRICILKEGINGNKVYVPNEIMYHYRYYKANSRCLNIYAPWYK